MPTQNNHSSAIDGVPVDPEAEQRSRRIFGISIGATLLTVFTLLAAVALAPVDASAANTCTLTSTAPTTLWSDATKWSGCGGTYPGQGAGDTAIVTLGGGYTLKVDAFNNPVILQVSGSASSIPIQVASGGTLTLNTSSTATSSNTFTVDSGGTMGTSSGANITGFQASVHVNGGTFNSAGTIQLTSGTFTYSGGSLTGSGTINITNSGIFDGAVGAMPVSGTTINNSGFVSYTSASNALNLSSGASINVTGAGQFSIASDAAINGTAAETISIANGASMQKTSGTGFNVISPFVKNDGTINVSGAGAGGGFGLSGSGTHSGSFVTGSSSQTIAFGGSNAFNSGASFSGSTPVKFVAGTQTFNAAVTASGGIKWAGGTIAGTGPLTVSGTSTLDGSNSGMILTGVINNTGAMTYAPTVITNLLTFNGASAKLDTAGGSFTIAGDFDIQAVPSGAGTLRVSGGTGQITKSAGASGSSILAYVDNASSTVTNNATGALNFAGGGKSTGNMSMPASTNIMNFTNGTFDDNGVFSGLGTINIAGGTLNINAGTSFGSGSPSLNINGGTLGGTGTVTIFGASNWSNGTITGSSPFNVSSTGVMAITGALGPMTLDGRVFNDNSSVVYNSPTNNMTLKNSASIVNSGTFTAIGSGTIDTDGSAVSITNNGQFNKTSSGLFQLKPPFNNAGTGVAITGGFLDIEGTGTSSAQWTMSGGTEVWFPTPFATTYTWASGTSFSGGKVTIDGSGTVATSFPMTLNNTSLEVNGGIFSTPSLFTVTAPGTLKWTGGTLSGAGHTAISSGTTFDLTTENSSRSVSAHTIDNAGNATLSATSQPPSLDSGSTFNNTGTFDIQSDGSMLTNGIGTNWFNNFGTAKKTGGGSGFRFDVLYAQIAGTTDANSATSGSTIIINGGGAMTGGVMKATQSTNFVDFFNGTFSASSGGSFSGPGAIRVNGGTLNFLAPYNLPPLFNETAGSLGGSGIITIPNAAVFNWSGGSITASAGVSITIQSGGTMNADTTTSSLIYDTRSLFINAGGNFNWNNGANAIVFQSAAVANDGTFTVATSGGTLGNATSTLLNTGLFKHTGAGTLNITLRLTNGGGTVSEQGGVLAFLDTNSVTHSGTFDAQPGTFLDFGAGTHNLSSGSSFTGTGTFKIAGATLNANTNVSAANLILFAGTLGGTANLTTTSSLIWNGGSMTGTGTTIAASGTAQLNTGSLTLARNLTLSVNTTYGGGLFVQNGVTITNNGTFDIQAAALSCTCAPASTFVNNGTLRKSGSLTPVGVSIPISGPGALDVTGGWLQLTSNASFGSASIASGTIAQFSGAVNSITGAVTGAGTLLAIGGSTTVGGTINLPTTGSIEIQPATLLTLNGTVMTNNLLITGGTITGTGNVTANVFSFLGGSLTGTGSLTVTATLVIQGSTGPMTLSRNLVNNAPTGIYNPPNIANILSVSPGVTITNNGVFEIRLDLLALAGAPVPAFVNTSTGQFFRTGGTPATIAFGPAVSNAGTLDFSLGTTNFTNGVVQTAGVTAFSSPIGSPTGFAFNGGVVFGSSTLTGDVNNTGATFTVGNPVSPAACSITGNYTQANGATLTMRINGTTAGTQYGQLAVNGDVTLAGALTVVNPLGYTPNNGDAYDVLTFTGTRTNDFGTKNFPTPGPGGFLTSSYVSGPPAALAVTAVMQPADISAAQSGPAGVFQGQNATIVITIANAGPGPATNVVLNDTISGGVFVSATPSSGSCSGTGPISCNVGVIAGSSSATVTLVLNANAVGTITNNASVSTTSTESNTGNNTASPINIAVTASADLAITKTGPVSAAAGFPIIYTITVTNNGPSDAAAVSVSDATPANTTFVSNAGACTAAFPCALGTMTAGQSKTITSTFNVSPAFTGASIANSATVTSATSDPNAGNNTATATASFGSAADLAINKSGPASATTGSTVTYTLTITNTGPGAAANVSVFDSTPAGLSFIATGGGCTGPFPCSLGTLASGQSVSVIASYTVTATSGSITNTAQVSGSTVDGNAANDSSSVTTSIGTNACGLQPPSLVAPANGATLSSPVTFSWTAVQGATGYKLFASIDGASTQEIGSTSTTSLTLPIASGNVTWSVQALGVPNCTQLNSATRTFSVCSLDAPVIAVVGTNTSGQTYTVSWTALPGITSYELQEAAAAAFDNPTSFTVAGTSRTFTKNATTPTAFYYRVRALGGCSQSGGPFSASERVVIVPIPPINTQDNSATVDINNKKVVVQNVFIPGQGPATPYSAATDEPWLTVSPATGILLPQGITLLVSADPADLPNGTFTATIILTLGSSAKAGALDTKPTVSVPVSVSVVTPVSPANLSTPPANSLIIPSVGHLDGINSQWRSDVRITNTAQQKINYLLRFTPAGGDPSQIKQTQISIAANDTTALDDIVKNWYGVGALGDAANGVLEVRPLNTSGKGAPDAEDVNISLVTVASSRTFNQSAGGTLGQYIPAIPFANFIGKVISGDARAGILSMQQIAQSAAYRTNLGIVEAAGKPASVLVSVFDAAGKNLLDLPIDLKAGEQQQLNSFLGSKGITLTDGRIEVKVTGGDGKVIAYASVVDNKTTDPLLVTGTPLAQTPSRSYVLPGVADLSNGSANWRSDLRVFNAGTDPQYVTMTLYPQTGSTSSDPISRSVAINPGEITILDNVLASRFGVSNIGGALHVDTLTDANLVVTGRTYNQVEGGGTYGQFIAAVTPADAVGKGGRTLNVLQVEDSTRYRTNLGIAEVSGKPATVEVSVLLPDAKVAPKVQIPLAANEYSQFRVLQQLGVGTAYNARITIRVIDGDGRIAAYGSVVDMQTQDPTYVPAQ